MDTFVLEKFQKFGQTFHAAAVDFRIAFPMKKQHQENM